MSDKPNNFLDRSKLITIGAMIAMFVGVTIIGMTFKADIDRNFDATREAEMEINQTLTLVNKTVTQQIERDMNLTQEESGQLVAEIRTIPIIVSVLENITEEVESDATGARIHRNLTIANNNDIRELREDVRQIFSIVISMNNKIDEMPFLKNVTDPPTNVFNRTG